MIHESEVTVRGYELDSFGHVNNSVYLNYMEHARWDIFKDRGLFNYFSENELLLVVTETNIKYIGEAKNFDRLSIKTKIELEEPYLVFFHEIFNLNLDRKITKATVKTLLIDKDRIPMDIPLEFLK